MANSKVIIIEGPQGAGKTTVTDFLRHSISYTNLYRLCGTSDTTIAGKQKAADMYFDLLEYMEKMENKSINLLFDRTFFSEENYCRLGKKEYTFTDEYEKLLEKLSKLDFDIYYITLYLEDENLFNERLYKSDRAGKAAFKGSSFAADNSIRQQRVYLEMAEEIKQKYPNINVVNIENSKPLEETKAELRKVLNF